MAFGLILIFMVLSLASQGNGDTEENTNNINNEVYEEELILEDWMTEPFYVDTVKKQKHV